MNLLMEAALHIQSRKFKCQFCKRPFSLKSNCVRHERIHTNDKPFKCPICLTRFILKKNMIDHKRVHTGEQPFTCEVCMKKFSRQNSLTRHAKIHTGDKPFSCNHCGKSFSFKYYLIRHIHSSHKPKSGIIETKQNKTRIFNHEVVHTVNAIEIPPTLGNKSLVEVTTEEGGKIKYPITDVSGKPSSFSIRVPKSSSSTSGICGGMTITASPEYFERLRKKILKLPLPRCDQKEKDSQV